MNKGTCAHLRMAKAHGTGNSFLVYVDDEDGTDLIPEEVRRLCSSAFGIGADGLMRAVRREGRWFMDYRNADGSLAEMCGNGIRVFVDHLRREGLFEGALLEVGTRGGVRQVLVVPRAEGGVEYRVDMGAARSTALEGIEVRIPGLGGARRGIFIEMPNPHTVIAVESEEELASLIFPTMDADRAPSALRPALDPAPARGTNLEAVVDLGDDEDEGVISMRVLERGVGETLSCGTGCCAAALATAIRRGPGAPDSWRVRIPGGEVRVDIEGVLEFGEDGPRVTEAPVILTGPAERVALVDWANGL